VEAALLLPERPQNAPSASAEEFIGEVGGEDGVDRHATGGRGESAEGCGKHGDGHGLRKGSGKLENGIGIAKEDWNGLKLILEGKKVVRELDEDRVMVRAVSEDVGQDRGIERMGEGVEEMKERGLEVIQHRWAQSAMDRWIDTDSIDRYFGSHFHRCYRSIG
jgi:hypothetical protein